MKKIIIILLLKGLFAFGQDYRNANPRTIKIDSIEVKFFYNQKVEGIEAESYFKKSNTKLRTIYYFDEKIFYIIVTQEKSKNAENIWRTNVFQYENGKLFYQKESYYSDINGNVVEHPKDNSEIYNNKLGSDFLKKYVIEVYNKIKNYQQ